MSSREHVMQLIEDVPEHKLIFIINILEGLKGYAGEMIEPDEWDLEMIAEAERINDGQTLTLEEVCQELDIIL